MPANAGNTSSVPGSGRSPGEGNGYPLQCSCLGNSMDRGAWRATVHGVTELDMPETNTFPGGLVVRTLPSSARGADLVPGRGTKIPHATGCGQKKPNTAL